VERGRDGEKQREAAAAAAGVTRGLARDAGTVHWKLLGRRVAEAGAFARKL